MENAITDQLTVIQVPDTEDLIYKSYFDYNMAKQRLDRLIGDWCYYKDKAIRHRNARRIDLQVEQLRSQNIIGPDETMTPVRLIDLNITRDKADAMGFLNSANRLAYFRCIDDPIIDCRQMESDFTKGMTYEDWYLTFDRHYDGAALHGWDSIEVVYDESKPLHVRFDHIGYDRLIFNPQVSCIQDSSFLLLESRATSLNLQEMVKDENFDPVQVQLMTQQGQPIRNDDKIYTIYKVFFKYDDCVYVAWYSKQVGANGWLKAPEHARLGLLIQPPAPPISLGSVLSQGGNDETEETPSDNVPSYSEGSLDKNNSENSLIPTPTNYLPSEVPGYVEEKLREYPVFLYIYMEDEQHAITDKTGRAFLDMPQQEGMTSLTSNYVNSMNRAQNVFASPKESSEETNKLEDITLEPGAILPVPMEFFHMPYPDPSVLQGLQYLDSSNSQQTGRMAVSVSNRQDSRKTAKELTLAEQEQNKISSTDLATYNDFLRKLYAFCWKIVQKQAMADRVKFSLKNINTQGLMPESIWVNDKELISKDFDVRAAGEIDVLQKNIQINSMMQDWPVISNTPVASVFMEDFLRLRYPLRADYYIAKLREGDMGKQLIQGLMTGLVGAVKDPQQVVAMHNDPNGEASQKLQQLLGAAMQYLQPPQAPK